MGKKVNGVLVEGFLYRNQLQPAAWLDGAGAVKATFIYGLHSNVPEYMVQGTTTYRIITDQVGSVRLVVNTATGAVVERVDYDEFGNALADTAPGTQPFGFAGGLREVDTVLTRFGARDYDPATSRWTSKDPESLEGGLNLYEYAANDPINHVDPFGDDWMDWDLSGAANFAAGMMGDSLSFGLTGVVRGLMGVDDVVDKCSRGYQGGQASGTALSIAFGAAHLGRNLVANGGRLGRLAFDPRTWRTVRSERSAAMGGLRNTGQSLHHWLIPQRWGWVPLGLRNAGFNFIPLSAGFNSWMNGFDRREDRC